MSTHTSTDKSAEAELLPCPFCGGKAEYDNDHDEQGNAVFECAGCGANVFANVFAEGIARWNRRAPAPVADGLPPLDDAVIAGIMGWRGPGAYTAATLRKIREVIAADRQARASVPAEVDVHVATINSDEFQDLLLEYWNCTLEADSDRALIAYIDSWANSRASVPAAGAVQQPVAVGADLPRWIDDQKGKDPLMDDVIAYIIDLRAQLARQSQGEPVYQVQYHSEKGTSVWHDASEAAYHTFMPERRRIVYAAPAPGNTQTSPHALDDDKKGDA